MSMAPRTHAAAARHRAPTSPRRSRRRRRWLLLIALVLLGGAGVYAALLARDVQHEIGVGRAALQQGMARLTTGQSASQPYSITAASLDTAAVAFRRAEGAFERARGRLGVWGDLVIARGDLLPGQTRQAQSALLLLEFARRAAGLAAELSNEVGPAIAVLHAPRPAAGRSAADTGTLVRLTAALASMHAPLAQAEGQLAVLRAARHRLTAMPLPAGAAPLLATFDRHAPELADALSAARHLPALLGADGRRSYLLLFQDPTDLRATGGYIGSASLVMLERGRLSQIDYEDSRALQVPADRSFVAPLPLFYYMTAGSFQLRDAGYYPDFPTSAAKVAQMYRAVTGRRLDGVVALQPAFVSYLLRAVGPVAVPGYGETVTPDNVVDRIDYYAHRSPGANTDPHRKHFIVALNHAVLDALQRGSGPQLAAALPAVQQAFADRAVMLAVLTDHVVAQSLHAAQWDGALRAEPGDYLAVYDQNMSDSKLNPFIDQEISYVVQRRRSGGLESRVTVTYHNHAPLQTHFWYIPRTSYQDYVRVAVPLHSTVGRQLGYDDTFWQGDIEGQRLLLAGGLRVPPGASRSITITYAVPPTALVGMTGYRLLVQKQPGSRPAVVLVRVSTGGRTWAARSLLERDTIFATSWAAPSGSLGVDSAGR